MTASSSAALRGAPPSRADAPRFSITRMLVLLSLRLVLFAVFQAAIAGVLAIAGEPDAWAASAAWWPISATAASLVNLGLLVRWARIEGFALRDFYAPARSTWRSDLGWALVTVLIAAPLAALPNLGLATLLLGSPEAAWTALLQPLPTWAVIVSLAVFPIAIASSELPMYYGYVQPRLARMTRHAWVVVLVPALFLSLQHATLPLVLDLEFALWRALQFLLFAIVVAVALRWRPRLLPYFVIVHFFLDLQVGLGLLAV